MREIVHIQAGRNGNQKGVKYWEVRTWAAVDGATPTFWELRLGIVVLPACTSVQTLCREHGLDATGSYVGKSDVKLDKVQVCFRQDAASGRYLPRTILTSLDPECGHTIAAHPYGQLFNHASSVMSDDEGGFKNWAHGYHSQGPQLLDAAMDAVRKETELCDSLQGFQLMHGLGGGCGSGLGSLLLLTKLHEEYPDQKLITFSSLPSWGHYRSNVTELYNVMLSVHQLVECADACVLLDLEALLDIFWRRESQRANYWGNIHSHTAAAMAGITCGMHFPSALNGDLQELVTSMAPQPRLHFLMASHVPLGYAGSFGLYRTTAAQLAEQMCVVQHMMCTADPSHGRCLATAMFQGRLALADVQAQMLALQDKASPSFVGWLPQQGIKYGVCGNVHLRAPRNSATLLCNTTAVAQVFQQRCVEQCGRRFSRKAFFGGYTAEGMDEGQFAEALSGLADLVAEYQQQQQKPVPDMGTEQQQQIPAPTDGPEQQL